MSRPHLPLQMQLQERKAARSGEDKSEFGGPAHLGWGVLGGSDGKEPACDVGDPCLIPGSGRSPGEGNGNLL